MTIASNLTILRLEKAFERTPTGFPIGEESLEIVRTTIEDTNNHNQPVFSCPNCCIIISSLLVPSGCPNCGYKGKTK